MGLGRMDVCGLGLEGGWGWGGWMYEDRVGQYGCMWIWLGGKLFVDRVWEDGCMRIGLGRTGLGLGFSELSVLTSH